MSSLGTTYPNGKSADSNDWLVEHEEHLLDAHELEAAGYMNAAYGQALTDQTGRVWLEYWYWYYYNPKDFAGIGHHEGDWESVLVALDANNKPEEVVLSQHDGGAKCEIGEVERTVEGGPVVYVGLDSHANYPRPGTFSAVGESDHTDGAGPSVQPGLVILDDSPSWLSWPGHWGGSRAGEIPGEANSPTGPKFHSSWTAPEVYAAEAEECEGNYIEVERELAATPRTSAAAGIEAATLVKRHPRITYRVPGADGEGFWPRLRITVDERGDGGIPPVSKTLSAVRAKGETTFPVELRPGHSATVLGSLVYKDGRRVHLAPQTIR